MTARITQRDADAARYRAEGWTYHKIANEVGFADPSSARKSVQRALKASVRDANDTAIHLALNALDAMAKECWQIIWRTHVVVSNGRVVELDGVPIPDDAPVLQAIDRLLKIQDRASKLLGLDEPVRSKVEVITTADVQQAIDELIAEEAREQAARDHLAAS